MTGPAPSTVPEKIGGRVAPADGSVVLFWIRRLAPWLVLTFAFLHLAKSVFPFQPVEGDDQNVANGLIAWAHGWANYRKLAYLFVIQPGSYHLLHALGDWTGLAPFQVFGATSAAAGVVFFIFATVLVAELSGLGWAWCGLLLLDAQEISGAWSYANTSTLAGAAGLGALLVVGRGETLRRAVGAGLLIALSGALRLDALLMAPACWPLLAYRTGDWRSATRATLVVAGVALLATLGFRLLDHDSLAEAWYWYGQRGVGDWRKIFQLMPLTLSPALLVAALVGSLRLFQRMDLERLVLIALGTLPSLVAYGPNFTTPKYFYYAIPFAVFPAAIWLRELARSPRAPARRILWIWIIVAVFPVGIGLRSTAPVWQRFRPSPESHALTSIHFGSVGVIAVIGSGEIVGTADGFRLSTGTWYAPAIWRREKREMAEEISRLRELKFADQHASIVTGSYLSDEIVQGELMREGLLWTQLYQPFPKHPDSRGLVWSDGHRQVLTTLITDTPADATEFNDATRRYHAGYFLNDRGREVARHFGVRAPEWTCFSPSEDGLITLYRRTPRTP